MLQLIFLNHKFIFDGINMSNDELLVKRFGRDCEIFVALISTLSVIEIKLQGC